MVVKGFFSLMILMMIIILSSCIGDDIIDDTVDPEIRISNIIDTLEVGTEYQFEYSFFNNIGVQEDVIVMWQSTDSEVISINSFGISTAIKEGSVEITASTDFNGSKYSNSLRLISGEETTTVELSIRSGTIRSTSSYELTGDFELELQSDGSLKLDIRDNYKASSSLPGLYIYLSNNPGSTSGAHEIGKVEIFEGAHSYEIPGVAISDFNYLLYYCKPFNVKVGDGLIND